MGQKNLKGRDFLDDLGIYRRIILQHTLNKQYPNMWTGLTWQKTGTSGSILLEFVSMILNLQGIPCLAHGYQILKDDCSLWLKGIQ
jgi:hypothetical protein